MALNWRELTSARRSHWPSVRGALPRKAVQDALGAGVLVLSAPAGYGKTTALSATLPGSGVPGAWLSMDADDTDPQVFASNLALSVAHLPGGSGVAELLDQGASPARVAARVADVLHLSRAWLVLDEAQHLASPLLGGMLRELLDCGEGHVALLSRVPLDAAEFVPLEAAGVLTRLGAAELSFSAEEMEELLRSHGRAPSAAEVRLAHSLTEGWPIAARYLAQAASQGRVQLSDLRDLDGGEVQLGTLFTYLAQEVLGPLEPPLRDLLTRSSVFEDLTPELLSEVLSEPQAGPLLEALAGSGTFLTRLGQGRVGEGQMGEGLYRAHPLLRAHLRSLLPPSQVREISARGAAYFERTGRYRRALGAALAAGTYGQAARLLSAHGQEWLALGRVNLVERSLARLPQGEWPRELHVLQGDTLRLLSRYDEAGQSYALADDFGGAVGRVRVALDTVQPDQGWEALECARVLAQTPEEHALVGRLRAENLLNAGRLPEAVALESSLKDSIRYALRSGEVHRALSLASRAAAGETGGPRAAQNHRESLLLASFLHALTGQAAAAVEFARQGLQEGERLESPFVQALAHARLGHALMLLPDAVGAAQAYFRALDAAQGVTGRLQVEALMGLMTVHARQGEWGQAQASYQGALSRTGGDAYMAGLLHLRAGINAVQHDQNSQDALRAAREAFTVCGDRLGLTATALTELAADEKSVPTAELAEALTLYPFLLTTFSLLSPVQERARRAKLLARIALAFPQRQAAWLGMARELGYADLPGLLSAPGFEVFVQVLGRPSVRGQDGLHRDWGRARAKDLLLLLVAHPGGVARLHAQETLFPDAEPGVGERNFRVTLHALAQVLEQDAPSGTFLERGEWLRLRESPDLRVDDWQVRAALNAPAGSAGRLETLLMAHPTFADSDLPELQEVAAAYLQALPLALAEEAHASLSAGKLTDARQGAERALILDAALEPAARTLMRVFHQEGNVAGIQRVYGQLKYALGGMHLSPLPETSLLYQTLTSV